MRKVQRDELAQSLIQLVFGNAGMCVQLCFSASVSHVPVWQVMGRPITLRDSCSSVLPVAPFL